jgi:hypothetical protein
MLPALLPLAWSKGKVAVARLAEPPQQAYQPVVIAVSGNDVWIVMPKSAWPSATLVAQFGELTCLGEAEHPVLRTEDASWTRVAVEMAFFGYSTISFEQAFALLG